MFIAIVMLSVVVVLLVLGVIGLISDSVDLEERLKKVEYRFVDYSSLKSLRDEVLGKIKTLDEQADSNFDDVQEGLQLLAGKLGVRLALDRVPDPNAPKVTKIVLEKIKVAKGGK